jgi:hypothetical protein
MMKRAARSAPWANCSRLVAHQPIPGNVRGPAFTRTTHFLYLSGQGFGTGEGHAYDFLHLVDLTGGTPRAPVLVDQATSNEIYSGPYEIPPDNSHAMIVHGDGTDYYLYSVDIGGSVPGPRIRLNSPPLHALALVPLPVARRSHPFPGSRCCPLVRVSGRRHRPTRSINLSNAEPPGEIMREFHGYLP